MSRREVRVETGASRVDPDAYIVRIGAGEARRVLRETRGLVPAARRALAVVDANLPEPFVRSALAALREPEGGAGLEISRHTIDPAERIKTLGTLARTLEAAARARLERGDAFVALGGGIVGDLTGFAASTYRRGVGVIQCPTTLLAMVDASVGGKTGVNLEIEDRLIKNAAGAFHQPLAVAADTDALESLPARELSAGLGECLKHGMLGGSLGDPGLLDWTEANLAALRARDREALAQVIARGVAVKARAVEADERETASSDRGGRALLNLGHTFAHAIEGTPRCPFVHGEAVGLGLIAASAMSAALGLAGESMAERARELCVAAGLPAEAGGALPAAGALAEAMLDDKKARGGALRVIAPLEDHTARVVDNPDRGAVLAGWRAIGASG